MLKPWLLLLKLEGERNECRKMETIFGFLESVLRDYNRTGQGLRRVIGALG